MCKIDYAWPVKEVFPANFGNHPKLCADKNAKNQIGKVLKSNNNFIIYDNISTKKVLIK